MVQVGEDGQIYYTYDGNGNVSDLVDTNGTVRGHYEYAPFGGLTVMTGAMAASNPFRFSTKWFDGSIELYVAGRSSYSPNLGRWINVGPLASQSSVAYIGTGNVPFRRLKDQFSMSFLTAGTGIPPIATTGCDPETGTPVIPPFREYCAGNCLMQHEKQHAKDIGKCCGRLKKCMEKNNVVTCAESWNKYIDNGRPWFECRANNNEWKCARRIVKKNCCKNGTPKKGTKLTKSCCNQMGGIWRSRKDLADEACREARERFGRFGRPKCPFSADGKILEE